MEDTVFKCDTCEHHKKMHRTFLSATQRLHGARYGCIIVGCECPGYWGGDGG